VERGLEQMGELVAGRGGDGLSPEEAVEMLRVADEEQPDLVGEIEVRTRAGDEMGERVR
jgi:hypothetical protein